MFLLCFQSLHGNTYLVITHYLSPQNPSENSFYQSGPCSNNIKNQENKILRLRGNFQNEVTIEEIKLDPLSVTKALERNKTVDMSVGHEEEGGHTGADAEKKAKPEVTSQLLFCLHYKLSLYHHQGILVLEEFVLHSSDARTI